MNNQKRRKFTVVLLIAIMVLTMLPFTAFAGEATDIEWYNFRNNPENNGVTDKATPIDDQTAGLKWAGKYGTSYFQSPTPPLILDGYLYVGLQNKVYKIDKTTGEKVAESDEMVASVGYAMNPITYADGKLFVQVGNGMIQAIDYETLQCVWHTEKIGGQTVSPISYTQVDGKGYLYLGTWNSSSRDGTLMCVSTDDNNVDENGIKKSEWRFIPSGDDSSLQNIVYDQTPLTYDRDVKDAIEAGTAQPRGFYWAGAYACENFVAIGSDDGADDYGEPVESSCFYTLDPVTGEIIDKISNIKGDIRTTVVYDSGYLYFCTKGGIVYKVPVDEEGNLGEAVTLDLGGEITASPVIYNGRLYVGVRGQGGQFDPEGGHAFVVVNAENMTKMYDLPISGYPQASALLSTAYENEDFDGDGEADGRVYLYFTYNARPGGIYYTYDAKDQENAATESGELFVPDSSMQNYCISTICTDNDGVLYYKNDSGYLMAVQNKVAYVSNMEISGALSWSRAFTPGVTEYEVVMPAGTEKTNIKLTLPVGVTAKVDGTAYDLSKGVDVILDEDGKATVKITVTSEASKESMSTETDMYTTEYVLNIRCQGTDSSLESLSVSKSNTYGVDQYLLSPEFSWEKTAYTVDVRKEDRSFYNVWPKLSDDNSTIKVYAEENVSAAGVNSDGTIEVTSSSLGNDRYAIYPEDSTKDTTIRIEVTSESGDEVTNYKVTLLKETATDADTDQGIGDNESGESGTGNDNNDGTGSGQGDASSGEVSKTDDASAMNLWMTVLTLAAVSCLIMAFKREHNN